MLGCGKQPAFVRQPPAVDLAYRQSVMGAQQHICALRLPGVQDERRSIQPHIDPLRAILEIPLALMVASVVTADEIKYGWAADGLAARGRGIVSHRRKGVAGGM